MDCMALVPLVADYGNRESHHYTADPIETRPDCSDLLCIRPDGLAYSNALASSLVTNDGFQEIQKHHFRRTTKQMM